MNLNIEWESSGSVFAVVSDNTAQITILVPALLPPPPLHSHGVFVCLHEELNHKPGWWGKNDSKKSREIIFQLYQD